MKLEDLKEDFTFWDFSYVDKSELDILPYEIYKWNCCCKNCENGTTVRDYGFAPHYFLNRNSKVSARNPRNYWQNLKIKVWFCGKHWKYYNRLGADKMYEKFIDNYKPKLGKMIKKVNQNTEQLG